jgi:hypothetical protein
LYKELQKVMRNRMSLEVREEAAADVFASKSKRQPRWMCPTKGGRARASGCSYSRR